MLGMISHPGHFKSGHITCYLNRTYHLLTTGIPFVSVQKEAHRLIHLIIYHSGSRQSSDSQPNVPLLYLLYSSILPNYPGKRVIIFITLQFFRTLPDHIINPVSAPVDPCQERFRILIR
jgi:hypothetical protein